MATIHGFMSVQITDYYGSTGSVPIYFDVPDTQTIAQLITNVGAQATLLTPLTEGSVSQVTITLLTESVPSIVTDVTAEIERNGIFNFVQHGAPKEYKDGIAIPAFNTAKLVNGRINLSDTDVAAWIAAIESVSAAFQIVSKFGFTLPTLLDTLMSFRKHRKSLTKRSSEVG
jgi:hypothetical protein